MQLRSFKEPLVAASAVFLLATTPGLGQIPSEFTNLQVLDSSISQPQLIGVMRSFAGALGVRCNHCHVGPDNLQGMDFATDEKATKKTARRMLQMVNTLNDEQLANLPVVVDREHQTVSCYTCHRGLSTPPRSSRELLVETIARDGVDAGIAQLEELGSQHADAGVYDFTPRNLAAVGRALFEQGEVDLAVTWLEGVSARNPDSADLPATLGMILLQGGKRDEALRAFDRALEIDPDNAMAKMAKERAGG
jgi:hypothetical protein